MDQDIKVQVKELIEQVESYETDFMDHCKMAFNFIYGYHQKFDADLVLKAVETSFERVIEGESFFNEFDTNGLGESLEAIIEYEIEQTYAIIDEAETEEEKKKAEKRLKRLEPQLKDILRLKAKDFDIGIKIR